ncbi:YeeE/YedE thiosulfate transporter family protein [Niabella terrae]
MMTFIKQPWPWYLAGPLIGLIVPLLLLLGNKKFGVSSSLRHICAACIPAGISFFKYDWKRESWNLFFVAGMALGGFIAIRFLADPAGLQISPALTAQLQVAGIRPEGSLLPPEIFSWQGLMTGRGLLLMVGGGFLVGFGTRWAGGCTSGHAIMGLSNLQWPSLVATLCFMIGGFIMTWLILPYILQYV